MNDEIIALAASKQFEDLSEEEQCFISKTLTESEYRQLSATLGLLPKIDADVAPSPLLKTALLAQFDSVGRMPNRAWYNYPIAVWKVAATAALLITGALFLRSPAPGIITKTEIVMKTDTVFVEKIMWKDRIVVREIVKQSYSGRIPHEMALADTAIIPAVNPLETAQPISAQPELLQFFTGESGSK